METEKGGKRCAPKKGRGQKYVTLPGWCCKAKSESLYLTVVQLEKPGKKIQMSHLSQEDEDDKEEGKRPLQLVISFSLVLVGAID